MERRQIPEDELDTFEEAGACGTAAVISPISYIDDALVLLVPGFILTRFLIVLIHLLRPDVLDAAAYALTYLLLAENLGHRGM